MDSPINEFEQQNFTKLKNYENDEKQQEQVNKKKFLQNLLNNKYSTS
jgi:hypothetical protein